MRVVVGLICLVALGVMYLIAGWRFCQDLGWGCSPRGYACRPPYECNGSPDTNHKECC